MAERIITGRTGEAHVTSNDDRTLNGSIIGRDGLYVLPWGDKFKITFPSEYKLKIGTGVGLFQGVQFMVDEPIEIDLEANAPGTYRRDRLYVKYEKDTLTGYESVSINVRTGDASTSGSPAVPPVIQENIWDGDGESFEQSMAILYYSGSDDVGYMNTWVEISSGMLSHVANKENPHQVTKTQVGLGNVDNTSDKDKEVKHSLTTDKLKIPFNLSFEGDMSGSVEIDGSKDVALKASLAGGLNMPFYYKFYVGTSDGFSMIKKFFKTWKSPTMENISITDIFIPAYSSAIMWTNGNMANVMLRLQLSDEMDMTSISLYQAKVDMTAFSPIELDSDAGFAFSTAPLYDVKCWLEYEYVSKLNYPTKNSYMMSKKDIPIMLRGSNFDSSGKSSEHILISDGTDFKAQPGTIPYIHNAVSPNWFCLSLQYPCIPIGGKSEDDTKSYIEIVGSDISSEKNSLLMEVVE